MTQIERNIHRVRNLLCSGLTVKEICTTIQDLPQEEIFLAFHSAIILLKDEANFYNDDDTLASWRTS